MPQYGCNLHDIFLKRNGHFSTKSVYSLGISILNIFEKIHDAGYIYNDLKLDNLMLCQDVDINQMKSGNDDIFENTAINIIDFGFATPYLEADE